MIRRYFWGILNAIRLKANNSMLEAKNARIVTSQIKRTDFRTQFGLSRSLDISRTNNP